MRGKMPSKNAVVDLIHMSPEKMEEKILAGVIEIVTDRLDAAELDLTGRVKAAIMQEAEITIKAKIDTELSKAIKDGIDALVFPATNNWGEKKGPDLTIREFCSREAAKWLAEKVDVNGRSGTNAYGPVESRITSIIHQYLHFTLEGIVKDAIKNANSILVGGIESTVKMKLEEISKSLKVNVTTK